MSKIKVKCTDQVLTWVNKPEISQGDQNLDSVVFECDETWNGYVKVGVFFKQKGALSYSMVDGTGTCSIPNSVMRENGKIYFGVTGTNRNNQVKTSNLLAYTIKDGVANASLNDEFPGELTDEEKEDVYHKMLELAQKFSEKLAFVQVKDVNEFEYNEAKFTEKVQKCIREINEEFETSMQEDIKAYKDNMEKKLRERDEALINPLVTEFNNYYKTVVDEFNEKLEGLDSFGNELNRKIYDYNAIITKLTEAMADAEEINAVTLKIANANKLLGSVQDLKAKYQKRIDNWNDYKTIMTNRAEDINPGRCISYIGSARLNYHYYRFHDTINKDFSTLQEKINEL